MVKSTLTIEKTMEMMEQSRNALILVYQDIRDAVQKMVNVSITADGLKKLKDNKYKLCFAKKVGDFDYNVVWQSYEKYMELNEFSWEPVYAMFGTNCFKESVTVKATCRPVKMGLGQITTLDVNGVLTNPVSGGEETALNLVNEYGEIHPGVNQLSYGIDGSEVSTPIYVAKEAMLSGTASLQPKEKVLVWFEQNIETGTMFSTARSKSVEIDLTYTNTANVEYDGDGWKFI